MKKNVLLGLMGLFLLVACEKEIHENKNTNMTIEQYSPIQENGVMTLLGKVSIPEEFGRETAKVGFYVKEFSSDMNNDLKRLLDEQMVVDAYQALMNDEHNDEYLWVDEVNADGTFEVSCIPQLKQYVCIAFAINAMTDGTSNYQVLTSKPFFFTGEATARLEFTNPLGHQFKLTFSSEPNIEVGVCWSATNRLPNIEDNPVRENYNGVYNEQTITSDSVTFKNLDFGDNDVVYLRGYVQKSIKDGSSTNSTSYKIIYSNVIEIRPKELVVEINSEEDVEEFMNLMYKKDSWGIHEGSKIWNQFRGKIVFNYEVGYSDWPYSVREDNVVDQVIPNINCTITGKGTLPYITMVSEKGVIKGMNVEKIVKNYGIVSETMGVEITSNYGRLTDTQNVYVYNNYGLIENCMSPLKYSMIIYNQSEGRIIDCETNSGIICEANYGYMENCLPDDRCCSSNYGVIKNPKDNHGHGDNSNAGGGIVEGE